MKGAHHGNAMLKHPLLGIILMKSSQPNRQPEAGSG
jgi:hypothetical protein